MNSILRGQQKNMNNNVVNQFNIFKQNPMQFLLQRRLNIPQNLQNNPQAMVQYLLNTGQMSQAQFNQLQGVVNNINR